MYTLHIYICTHTHLQDGAIDTTDADEEASINLGGGGTEGRDQSMVASGRNSSIAAGGGGGTRSEAGGVDIESDGAVGIRPVEAAAAARAEAAVGGQVVRACELNPACSICLYAYYLDEDVTLLPCGHLYHTEVYDGWEGCAGGRRT